MVVCVIGWFPCAIGWLNMQSDGWSIGINQFRAVVIVTDCQLPGSEFDSCSQLIYLFYFILDLKIHNITASNIGYCRLTIVLVFLQFSNGLACYAISLVSGLVSRLVLEI